MSIHVRRMGAVRKVLVAVNVETTLIAGTRVGREIRSEGNAIQGEEPGKEKGVRAE